MRSTRCNGAVVTAVSLALAVGLAGCGQGASQAAPGAAESAGIDGAGSAGADATAVAANPTDAGPDVVPEGVREQEELYDEEIAATKTSGPWRIGYLTEPAEPWFRPPGEGLTFREPAADETHHIEILPFEASTGRLVPNVPIRLEIVDRDGTVVDAKQLSLYYAEFFHYANNFSIPEAGTYTLRATLAPPTFRRHGQQSEGPVLAEGATVEFTGVELNPKGG